MERIAVNHIVRIDETGKAYGIVLRSVRMLRGSIAVITATTVIIPIMAISSNLQNDLHWSYDGFANCLHTELYRRCFFMWSCAWFLL